MILEIELTTKRTKEFFTEVTCDACLYGDSSFFAPLAFFPAKPAQPKSSQTPTLNYSITHPRHAKGFLQITFSSACRFSSFTTFKAFAIASGN
jgi:hypothetical protein